MANDDGPDMERARAHAYEQIGYDAVFMATINAQYTPDEVYDVLLDAGLVPHPDAARELLAALGLVPDPDVQFAPAPEPAPAPAPQHTIRQAATTAAVAGAVIGAIAGLLRSRS